MTRFDELLRRLIDGQVEFVIIGGVAAVAQGYDGSTFNFDICSPGRPGRRRPVTRETSKVLEPVGPLQWAFVR